MNSEVLNFQNSNFPGYTILQLLMSGIGRDIIVKSHRPFRPKDGQYRMMRCTSRFMLRRQRHRQVQRVDRITVIATI